MISVSATDDRLEAYWTARRVGAFIMTTLITVAAITLAVFVASIVVGMVLLVAFNYTVQIATIASNSSLAELPAALAAHLHAIENGQLPMLLSFAECMAAVSAILGPPVVPVVLLLKGLMGDFERDADTPA